MCHTGQRRRMAGGQREDKGRGSRWSGRGGGGDVCQEGWLGSWVGGNRRKKESLSGISHFALPIYQSLPFSPPCSHAASGFTLSFSFLSPLLDSSHCFSFLSRLYVSSHPSSLSFIPFIVLYLASAPSFHFCLFVCILTISSLLHLFTGNELGVRSVPVQSRLCHPTKRVGVKHRQQQSLPGRWHHIEANGYRET